MKITVKRAYVFYAVILAFFAGVVFLVFSIYTHGEEWATNRANRHLYSRSNTVLSAGPILDIRGTILAETEDNKRIYNDDAQLRKAILHVLGDTNGFISTGTQNFYSDALSGYSFVDGVYSLKTEGIGPELVLNIDSDACKVAYNALGKFNGCVAVYNYKTGELLCSVSKPTYDLVNKPDDVNTNPIYDGAYLDKVVSGLYTPGSIMKIVTAACAIENIPDIYERTFDCNGEYVITEGQRGVICNDDHKTGLTFEDAMNKSCNAVFAQIAVELGAEKLLATAESMGFNMTLQAREIRLKTSRFKPAISDNLELGWAGIGQSTTLVNPCHFLAIMGAIANGGEGYAPDRIRDMKGITAGQRTPEVMVSLNPETAKQLDILLRSNIEKEYGDERFPNLQMCGKTGTAQITGATSHSWFVGYSQREDLPLAVVCIAENAGSGMKTAVNVSNEVMQYFLDNPY
ncbi:MAG: penicillin-binding protein [Clostridia bacterium]|nr:penicillin-binding protein [Clostridia bacterium]